MRMPAPMPVPTSRTTASDLPRAAPSQVSPRTAALRSLSTSTGICRVLRTRVATGTLSQPGRLGAHTVPLRRTRPGTAMAAPASLFLPANSRAKRQIWATGAREEDKSTASVLRARNLPCRLTSAAASLVPPRSAAKAAGSMAKRVNCNRQAAVLKQSNASDAVLTCLATVS